MGADSPMFESGIELLVHALEHYVQQQDRDRRLVILHLANAAELVLKDALLDTGASIYRKGNRKETKGVWEVIDELKANGVAIQSENVLELLIEERNNIQHRFGAESEQMATWYVDRMLRFFETFLDQHFAYELQQRLEDSLPPEALQLIYPDAKGKDAFDSLRQAAASHPAAAILGAWVEVESCLSSLSSELDGSLSSGSTRTFVSAGDRVRRLAKTANSSQLFNQFRELQSTRSRVLHGRSQPNEEEARGYIQRARDLTETIKAAASQLASDVVSAKAEPRAEGTQAEAPNEHE